MKMQEAIKLIMKQQRFTQQRMADTMNTSQGSVNDRLNRFGISLDSAVEMLNIVGYELVIHPKTQGRRKEGQIVID